MISGAIVRLLLAGFALLFLILIAGTAINISTARIKGDEQKASWSSMLFTIYILIDISLIVALALS